MRITSAVGMAALGLLMTACSAAGGPVASNPPPAPATAESPVAQYPDAVRTSLYVPVRDGPDAGGRENARDLRGHALPRPLSRG